MARSRCSACGKNEKIDPPSLLVTTTDMSTVRRFNASRPFTSCNKATSPISNEVGEPEPSATPTAVLTTPSIPLAPRFECTVTPLVTEPNHSTSRIGMEDETTSWSPTAKDDVNTLATVGSEKFSAVHAAIAFCAAVSAFCQLSNHSLLLARTSGISRSHINPTSPLTDRLFECCGSITDGVLEI